MSEIPSPLISVIYFTKNGGNLFRQSLTAALDQDTDVPFEVLVIDSGSSDGTVEWLQTQSVRLQQIPPEEFSHSRTRNLGAKLAKADKYLIFINQDAVPSDRHWLNNMIRSIECEPDLKGASAMELGSRRPYFNVSGVATYLFRNSAVRGIYVIPPHLMASAASLPPLRLRELFPFATVCAIFDKAHFLKHPFDESVPWGEDLEWAVRNSANGFASACTSLAQVYHHHDYTPEESASIAAYTAELYRRLFGIAEVPGQELDNLPRADSCPDCQDRMAELRAMRCSLSWRLTAPLRRFADRFRRA